MNKLRIWATVSLTLAFLGLAALFLAHAALTDIYHGEKDAGLEWTFLRLAFLVIILLIIATIVSAGLVLKRFHGKEAEKKRRIPD